MVLKQSIELLSEQFWFSKVADAQASAPNLVFICRTDTA